MGSSPIRVAISDAFASVAQLVEQGTENPRVVGSIPTGGTKYADLAHLVERHLAKVEVAGSSPVIRSNKRSTQQGAFCFYNSTGRPPAMSFCEAHRVRDFLKQSYVKVCFLVKVRNALLQGFYFVTVY